MNPTKKQIEKHLQKIDKVVKNELGLKGKNGIYTLKSGFIVDLTATAPDRLSILATIGLQFISHINN